MNPVTIRVREAHQFRSLDHFVHFDALIVPFADDLTVEMELIDLPQEMAGPMGGCNKLLQLDSNEIQVVLRRIRDGAKAVLEPQGFGAIIQVSNLIIHPVDFIEQTFERYTIEYLRNVLPTPDSLVCASEEPMQAQEGVLLRAAAQGQETPPEQLVRAVNGQE